MDVLERARQTEFLGREFLVWLWFKSEKEEGLFDLGDIGTVEISLTGKMTLESSSEEEAETITCSGDMMRLKEARFALTEDKQVTQAGIRLIRGDDEWTFSLDSTWMNFKTLKPPKVMQDFREDPDGLFYERMFLIEQPLLIMNAVYVQFIERRISPEWDSEDVPALIEWANRGRGKRRETY